MSSVIPAGCVLVSEAIEKEGRDLFVDKWTGEERRERARVLQILDLPAIEQVRFDEAALIGEKRQAARNRLLVAYESLRKKCEDGRGYPVLVDSYGVKHVADRSIFRSVNVWKWMGGGIAPLNPGKSDAVGELYIEDGDQQATDHTGAPGAPSSSHLVLQELKKRIESGRVEQSLRRQAEVLAEWLKENHPNLRTMTPGTIENSVREIWRGPRK
jgi:hypothetical protein